MLNHAVLQVRFAVSADTSFQKVGGGTNYDDFNSYKRLLETQCRKAPIRFLFHLWDISLFQGVEHRPTVNDNSMDVDLNVLQALDDESSDGESG